MCLILVAWQAHPDYPLVFAGNRDESYDRPTAQAAFWREDGRVYAGRDLERGGTWLGVSLTGRIAAVTNYRERPAVRNAPRSRGELTAAFLRGMEAPGDYLESVARSAAEFGAFSLLVGDGRSLWYYSNRSGQAGAVTPGVHGLSNHLLDTPWPKVASGKERLARLLGGDGTRLVVGLFDILLDRTPAPDADLPDTGVGQHRERELSPLFVAGERYGTRASTVVLIGRDRSAFIAERTFGPRGVALDAVEQRLALGPLPAAAASIAGAGR